MSKVVKSSRVTVDKNRKVTIEVPRVILAAMEEQKGIESGKNDPVDNVLLGKVLVEEAKRKAGEILDRARQEAAQLIEGAELRVDGEMGKAREKGWNEGYEKGAAEAEDLKAKAREIVEEAYREKAEILSTAEPEVVELILELVGKVLYNEADINPRVITLLVKTGLSQTTPSGNITVKVSQDDYEALLAGKGEILASFGGMAEIDIVKDTALKKSDCIIETDFGSVDCGLDSQYREFQKNLSHLLKNR